MKSGAGLFLVVFLAGVLGLEAAKRSGTCRGLARYNVTFTGQWSQQVFPKQYPLFRPHAQWSKIVGRTHGDRYSLFKVGEKCSEAIKQFSQLGTTDLLDKDPQGANDIFDLFTLPAIINEGVGTTSGRVFVNGRHSQVSLVSKIIPSPDWFVGVSALELCSGNEWIDSFSKGLSPMDGGTDQGYTFTAPNWPSIPPRPIAVITSQEPHHPANSFYYPDLQELPILARVDFRKVAEYASGRVIENDPIWETNAAVDEDDSGDISIVTELPINGAPIRKPQRPKNALIQKLREQARAKSRARAKARVAAAKKPKVSATNRFKDQEQEDEGAEDENLSNEIEEANEEEATLDCLVTDWTEWGSCSKTCGFGRRARTRSILQRTRGYGRPCPPLVEDELCGSMRTCSWNHFQKFRGFGWEGNSGG